MAVVLAFRIAIALSPTAYRVVKWEQAASGQPGPTSLPRALWDRLRGDEDEETLSLAVGAAVGRLASVDNVEGTFEVRKLQVVWSRTSGAAVAEDSAITTHHFLYAPGGTPTDTWAEAQFLAVETAFDTFVATFDQLLPNLTVYDQLRWYKAGPNITPPQAPVRIVEKNLLGSGSPPAMPAQTAMSVTEKTNDAKSWGRFYLPAMVGAAYDTQNRGRFHTNAITAVADGADALYEACIAADVFPVVYSSAKPARETSGGTELPARDARALIVRQIQIDDVPDVIRSRRWDLPLLRLQRDVAGS